MFCLLGLILCFSSNNNAQSTLDLNKKNTRFYWVSEFGLGFTKIQKKIYSNQRIDPFSNLGVMFKTNSIVSLGAHSKLGIAFIDSRLTPFIGLRARMNCALNNNIHWNISPGIWTNKIGKIQGYDLETSISWKDYVGIYLRWDVPFNQEIYPSQSTKLFSLGIFTKGKKGFWSAFGSAMGIIVISPLLNAMLDSN